MSDLTEALQRMGKNIRQVDRWSESREDLWDFSSPASCQVMLDTLVVWGEGETPPSGQELFDFLPTLAAELDARDLSVARNRKVRETRQVLAEKLSEQGDEVTIASVDALLLIWPTLNTAAAGPKLLVMKAIIDNAQADIAMLKAADAATVAGYNPRAARDNW